MKYFLHGKICVVLGLAAWVVTVAALCAGFAWQRHSMNRIGGQVSTLAAQVSDLRGLLDGPCPSSGSPVCQRYTYTSAKGVPVLVFAPLRNAAINSPVVVMGEVPGNWCFEAEFPIELKDETGAVVAHTSARVFGDWQTTQLVPFTATLTYGSARTGSGMLVLHNDNPSGLPDKADVVSVPVIF